MLTCWVHLKALMKNQMDSDPFCSSCYRLKMRTERRRHKEESTRELFSALYTAYRSYLVTANLILHYFIHVFPHFFPKNSL